MMKSFWKNFYKWCAVLFAVWYGVDMFLTMFEVIEPTVVGQTVGYYFTATYWMNEAIEHWNDTKKLDEDKEML